MSRRLLLAREGRPVYNRRYVVLVFAVPWSEWNICIEASCIKQPKLGQTGNILGNRQLLSEISRWHILSINRESLRKLQLQSWLSSSRCIICRYKKPLAKRTRHNTFWKPRWGHNEHYDMAKQCFERSKVLWKNPASLPNNYRINNCLLVSTKKKKHTATAWGIK